MNILHVTEDFSTNSGGLRTVIKALDNHLNTLENINSFIVSSQEEPDDLIVLVKNAKHKPWLYSKDWKLKLIKLTKTKNISIIHIHGVWMYPQYVAAKFAIKNKIPFIVSPHGMYEPWLWNQGRFKKRMYFNLLTKTIFSKANRIHAITKDEEKNLKVLFPKPKSFQVPNLITFRNHKNTDLDQPIKEKYILFLGRLHEKKGIELLINSLYDLNLKDVVLKIAGGFNNYKDHLDIIVDKLGLNNKVHFLGLVKGEEKKQLFKNAFVFVAPSYSEVVGMVNLEAAQQKTPVITTYQTGLDAKWGKNGGILINPIQEDLKHALKEVFNWSDSERKTKGEQLYNFVKINYSWNNRLKDWIYYYKIIIEENNANTKS